MKTPEQTLSNAAASFARLVTIMDELREKCPWDKKQTVNTLRTQTIEETYELADAITQGDWKGIKEELGDLLLHIVFYSRIGAEEQQFALPEMINAVCDKLIHRHPHIYGNVTADNEEEVKKNWEQLKLKEGKTSVLQGVPVSLPALVKAQRIQEKVKQVGFEWDNREDVFLKIEEEMGELQEAVASGNDLHMEEELGDVLFSLINYSRFLKIDAESALEKTNQKFMSRFKAMELAATQKGLQLQHMSLAEMDGLWNEVKRNKNG